jgi:hypothetical protein
MLARPVPYTGSWSAILALRASASIVGYRIIASIPSGWLNAVVAIQDISLDMFHLKLGETSVAEHMTGDLLMRV